MPSDGLGQRALGQSEFHRDRVPVVAQFDVDALGEAVEGAGHEQDVHGGLRRRTVRAATPRSTAMLGHAEPPGPTTG